MTDNRPFILSDSAAATVSAGRRLAAQLQAGDVIALIGELGAGKTHFTRGVVEGLGGEVRAVSSPTFVLMQEYDTSPVLVHIDAYRINDLGEVREMGWTDELIAQSITIIEWADRIGSELPARHVRVEFEHIDPNTRLIRTSVVGGSVSPCPVCEAAAIATSPWYPFCCKRCRTIDLGRWLGGDYKVSREIRWDNDDDVKLYEQESP